MANIVEILQQKENYEVPIDYIVIDGTKFTNYGAFTFMWEKIYVSDESLQRTNDGSIPQIEDASFFITPHLKIDFSLLSIDDFRALLNLEYENNQHLVIVYDALRKQEWIAEYMYIATLEMPKLWTIVENRQKGVDNWEHWISLCGVQDYTIELIGTNNQCDIPAIYNLLIYGQGSTIYWGKKYGDTYTNYTYRSFNEIYEQLESSVPDGYAIYDISNEKDITDTSISFYRREKPVTDSPIEYSNYDEISVNTTVKTLTDGQTVLFSEIVAKDYGTLYTKTSTYSSAPVIQLYMRTAYQANITLHYQDNNNVAHGSVVVPTNTWIALGSYDAAQEAVGATSGFNGYFNTALDGSGINLYGYEADTEEDYIMFVVNYPTLTIYGRRGTKNLTVLGTIELESWHLTVYAQSGA